MYALESFIAQEFQACVRAYAGNSAQLGRKGIAVLCFWHPLLHHGFKPRARIHIQVIIQCMASW